MRCSLPVFSPEAMSLILFRTNAGRNTGLGHVARCATLARELAARGTHVIFVVDWLEPDTAPFLAGIDVRQLYDEPQQKIAPLEDARALLAITGELHPDWIVLDDYRIGVEWEREISRAGLRLCAIDDLLRPHHCDLLLDYRWRGEQTQAAYDALIPHRARRLLGPAYTLLAEEYRRPCPEKGAGEPFTIMLGLGGGGEMTMLTAIIERLLGTAESYSRPIRLLPLIGPLAFGGDALIERYRDNDAVTPLRGETDLYPYLCRCDLYIGAAGTTTYQLLALGIPALTFSIADNQKNELPLLEDIGHYFHLNNWTEEDAAALLPFVATAMHHHGRITQLIKQARCRVDGMGTARIADVLLGEQRAPQPTVVSEVEPVVWQSLSGEHRLRPVTDKDINHYLDSRNLEANRRNMTTVKPIPRLHHYAWWFGAARESYLLEKQQRPCLYIWHEKRGLQGREFLIGGWFVCESEPEFQDALLALSWQLEHCDERYPGVPWLAVIQRENRFVKLMNDYVGFTEIGPDHPHAGAISALFPGAGHEQFYFVIREAPEAVPY